MKKYIPLNKNNKNNNNNKKSILYALQVHFFYIFKKCMDFINSNQCQVC